ncbi:hypothetical protein H9623_13010 [Oerskovia sp. Sa1BUA8]|uniref:ImmA/IrrE family metallo-endopeptidase n=1 Tax=Oerskovia douganii TaxID=2762210 RepID=A0A9D5Z061_9CELL|nr:hypothetical protein [Oerskovia douganii]MBE7701216.1 hypothetical protein [Oerskovia douganii]
MKIGLAKIAPLRGAWITTENVIVLDVDLDQANCNATLAHELAHIDLKHHAHQAPAKWFAIRWEREADDLACDRLLDNVDEIAEAMALHPQNLDMASDYLEVPSDVLWRRLTRLTNAEKLLIVERLDRIERAC